MDRTFVKEMLGSMTRFEMLTPELLSEAASEGLTYEELEVSMSQLDLDIRKILIDPNKKYRQAYYADFEKGFYCEILFQRSCLDSLLRIAAASLKEGNGNRHLEAEEWQAYYSCDVPVPMRIYDFQRRYLQIPEEEVFSVWRDIHTRIDYCNDMWDPEVLSYVLDRAPVPNLPELEADGRITVYRGMGEMSLPPEKALSWSTNPINALWFANRSGRGTKLLVARLKPEQIVAWFPSFRDENEVIVKPGAGIEYREENFIPSTLDYVPKLLSPAMEDLVAYARVARGLGYPTESVFQHHGLKHILRVLLLSLIYYYNSGDDLSAEDKQILIYFSLLHDYGREDEYVDDDHGEKSIQKIQRTNTRLRGVQLSRKGYRIAELLIRHHCHDDEVGLTAIQTEPGFTRGDKARAFKLYVIAKDMDGLDRVRFNGLDYRMLRTAYGRRLPLIAGGLLEEDGITVLCSRDLVRKEEADD